MLYLVFETRVTKFIARFVCQRESKSMSRMVFGKRVIPIHPKLHRSVLILLIHGRTSDSKLDDGGQKQSR